MMHDALILGLAGVAGCLIGTIFFGGLWWTVQRGISSRHPARWFLASVLARMSIAIAGFYVVGASHWQRLASCLAGFVVSRLAVTWWHRPTGETRTDRTPTAAHAP